MNKDADNTNPVHFQGKEAIEHVAEAKARGILSTAELHGMEMPGHLFAGTDAARETAVILLILWIFLSRAGTGVSSICAILAIFSFSWVMWKMGRSAWLAWSRLERMHRVVEQERWEIQHHRWQEREELKELYEAKGFKGQLLEDVLDVLMADEDRLLRVMVEEELCLSLATQEHPLRQGLGAAIGTACSATVCILLFFAAPRYGMWYGSLLTIAIAAAISAYWEDNRAVPAVVWNIGLAVLTSGSVFFLFEYFD